jgi:folate-binding protein YgfZ
MTYATLHATSPATSTTDLRAEFAALISGCSVFELSSRAKSSLSGKDRVRWLSGMITNKVRDLAVGQGIYAFVLNPQGHILGDLYAYNRGEWLLVDIDQAQTEKLLGIFRKYIIMDKVEIADLSDKLTAIGIVGPKARETLRAAGFEFQELQPLQLADMTWQNAPITIVRGDNAAVESYEIWLAPDQVASVREALTSAGAVPVGPAAVELLRIASGIPRYGQDIRERDLPQETEQLRALHFNKGCYIGQEIVERIRSRGTVHRKFSGFEVTGPLPAAGTKIQAEGKDVGEVTSAASLPLANGEKAVALGYIRREVADAGRRLQAGEAELTVVSLPFVGMLKK